MKINKKKILCPNCGKPCYGVYALGQYPAHSLQCFKEMIFVGKIPMLHPERAYPELGIDSPRDRHEDK